MIQSIIKVDRLKRRVALAALTLTLLSVRVYAQEEAPSVSAFPNAPGWITIVWDHSGDDLYGFVVERQSPPYNESTIVGVAVLNSPTRQFTDMNLQAETMYNHRVCAVYDYHRTCSDWISTTTLPPPSSRKPGTSPPPPPPPPLSTPVLKATAAGTKNIFLEWDYSYQDRLTSMALYRDDQFIFDGAIEGNFTSSHVDVAPRFNTEYTYKLCFSNPDEKNKCSEPVTVIGTPVAPTAPVELSVVRLEAGGESVRSGLMRLRPKPTISVTWRNTDVPGKFISLEALDTNVPGDTAMDGAVVGAPKQQWIESTRVSAKDDPTSFNTSVPTSLISSEIRLNTYRVCAVVPELGDNGKVCSQPFSIQ